MNKSDIYNMCWLIVDGLKVTYYKNLEVTFQSCNLKGTLTECLKFRSLYAYSRKFRKGFWCLFSFTYSICSGKLVNTKLIN